MENNNISENTPKKSSKKHRRWLIKRKKRKLYQTIIFAGINVSLIMVGLSVLLSGIINMYPYAITANGEVLCYVEDKDTGSDALKKAVENMVPDDNSDVLAVSVGDNFSIARNYKNTKALVETETTESAAECISNAIKKDPEAFPDISIATTHKETVEFEPEPTYELDEAAFAGTTVVKEEGTEGTKEVTVNSVTVNGEVVKEETVDEVILDEGKSEVIVKGKLGLPKEEDWETYEGAPVYSSGDDIVTTALSYVGKVQYVRGGTSLKTGVDCVGFVIAVYRLYGVKLSPYLDREGYSVSYANAQPGDILRFSHHTAIYIGDGMMVDAANPSLDIRVCKVSNCGQKLRGVRRIPTKG